MDASGPSDQTLADPMVALEVKKPPSMALVSSKVLKIFLAAKLGVFLEIFYAVVLTDAFG